MELAAAWSKLTVKRAVVKRLMGALVSITFEDGTEPATFRLPSECKVVVGATVQVAGDARFMQRLKVCVLEVTGQRAWVDRDHAMAMLAPQPPPGPPAFLPLLVEHGLLDRVAQVSPALYSHDAPSLLQALYPAPGAPTRGFVHWDHRWKNDTDDPIADLAQALHAPELRAIRIGRAFRFTFDATGHDVFDAEDLEEVGVVVDRWLSRDLSRPRLFAWVKGDHHVFLARPIEQGLALANALGDSDLVLASAQPDFDGI